MLAMRSLDEPGLDTTVEQDQNPLALVRLRPRSAQSRRVGRCLQREFDGKGRARARLAGHADLTAHLLHQALGDRKAQPRAAMAAGRPLIGLFELGEDAFHGLRAARRGLCPSQRNARSRTHDPKSLLRALRSERRRPAR